MMKKTYLILTIVILYALSAFAEVYITKGEAIRNIFPSFKNFKAEEQFLDDQKVEIFTVFNDRDSLGWAVVLDEMGKIKPITFLVGIDKQGKILDVYLLEYRDMFGSEIKRRSFLKQFHGKSSKDQLKVGRDIDAVTSATISSNAAAEAVRKSLEVIEILKNN